MRHFRPTDVGWRLGRSQSPRGVELWVPHDRTAGVYGPQGSGKTLGLLTPALLAAPGAALVTLTKLDDLLLTLDERNSGGRPVAVLDPFGAAPGVSALGIWFIYAAQTWRHLMICYGAAEARAMFGLTNNIVIFGGGKDGHFYREISELKGTARVARTTYSSGRGG